MEEEMKAFLSIALVAMLLVACSKKTSNPNDDDDDNPSTEWKPSAQLSLGGYTSHLRGLFVEGGYLYVTGAGGFFGIVVISDQDSMKLVGYRASNGSNSTYPDAFSRSIVKSGRFVACIYRGQNGRVEIFDVSNPASPLSVSSIVPINPSYEPMERIMLAGDTLAIDYTLYRLQSDGSCTFLKRLTTDDMASCGYGGIRDYYLGPEYWYFYGVCIDTTQHPKLWLMQRGSTNFVSENSLPRELYANSSLGTNLGTRIYRFGNSIFEVDASDSDTAGVTRIIDVPEGLNPPEGMTLQLFGLTILDNGFVLTGEQDLIVHVDGSFHYVKYATLETYSVPVSKGNMLYATGLKTLVAYRLN
jgi:hypothetical protein